MFRQQLTCNVNCPLTLQEVYCNRSSLSDRGLSDENPHHLGFLGAALSRYQAITSSATAGENLRRKRKQDDDLCERKSTKTVSIASIELPSKIASLGAPLTIASASYSRTKKPTKNSTNLQQSSYTEGDGSLHKNGNEKPAVSSSGVSTASSTARSQRASSLNQQNQWMLISGLPDSVSGGDIRDFLNGLKVCEIYGYYHYKSSTADVDGTLDAYVLFESRSGVSAALLRDGEDLRIDYRRDELRTCKASSLNNSNKEKIAVAASLHRITFSEASWAKALSVRLENSFSACSANLIAVRSAFPPSLLCTSPSDSTKKWHTVAPLNEFLLPEEVCSYAVHEKKSTGGNKSYRYDYKDSGGLRLDIHQMSGGISFCGLIGFSSNAPTVEKIAVPSLSYTGTIHGAIELSQQEQDVSHILDELGGTISEALLGLSDETLERSDCVLDFAHRMSCMYQFIHRKIFTARYLYKAS